MNLNQPGQWWGPRTTVPACVPHVNPRSYVAGPAEGVVPFDRGPGVSHGIGVVRELLGSSAAQIFQPITLTVLTARDRNIDAWCWDERKIGSDYRTQNSCGHFQVIMNYLCSLLNLLINEFIYFYF